LKKIQENNKAETMNAVLPSCCQFSASFLWRKVVILSQNTSLIFSIFSFEEKW